MERSRHAEDRYCLRDGRYRLLQAIGPTAGHAAGDASIRRVAHSIEQSVRLNEDVVFRYGGEEFLIVLTNATTDLAWTIAERIRGAVEALAIVNPGIDPVDGEAGVVTISLGVAFARDDAAPELVAKWAAVVRKLSSDRPRESRLLEIERNIYKVRSCHCLSGKCTRTRQSVPPILARRQFPASS